MNNTDIGTLLFGQIFLLKEQRMLLHKKISG
jgi:hypothetical protein